MHTTPPNYVLNADKSSLVVNPNESRPPKKKSRASRKTPTTILIADVSNFRALVQQLTGRPNVPIKVGLCKGPLHINFGKGVERDQVDGVINSRMVSSGGNNYGKSHQQHVQLVRTPQNHQRRFVEHDDMVSSSTSSFARGDDPPSTIVKEFDDFDVNDLCFEELAWLASSNGANGDI